MILTVAGCAGSFPSPDSPASCYLVSDTDPSGREWTIALDLGNGALGSLLSLIDPWKLDAVLLSHLHPDHCLDMASLYVHRTYHPQRPEFCGLLPVYGPAGTAERLDRAYHTDPGLAGEDEDAHSDLGSVFDFRALAPGATMSIGPFTITSTLVRHPVETYALRVAGSDGTVLAYSGDTDSCEGLDQAARAADVLLSEAAFQEGRDTVRGVHLTGLRAGETAGRAGAGSLLLTHVPYWTDRAQVLAEARAAYPGPLAAVERGQRYRVLPGGFALLETQSIEGER